MEQINDQRTVRHIAFNRHIELQIVSDLHEHQWVIHICELFCVTEFLFWWWLRNYAGDDESSGTQVKDLFADRFRPMI